MTAAQENQDRTYRTVEGVHNVVTASLEGARIMIDTALASGKFIGPLGGDDFQRIDEGVILITPRADLSADVRRALDENGFSHVGEIPNQRLKWQEIRLGGDTVSFTTHIIIPSRRS